MKTRGTLVPFFIFLVLLLLVEGALAGEAGEVSCTTPGCGYHTDLKIGGAKNSPSVTGYCPKEKKFVWVKIRRWEDYRQPRNCPGGKERLQPIYEGADVAGIPCPQCGNMTLKYQLRLLFD
jgi:hypothetical protein